jgi:hypothetical protein
MLKFPDNYPLFVITSDEFVAFIAKSEREGELRARIRFSSTGNAWETSSRPTSTPCEAVDDMIDSLCELDPHAQVHAVPPSMNGMEFLEWCSGIGVTLNTGVAQ